MNWITFLFIVIATEAVTEILVQSRIFFDIRHWLSMKNEMLAYFVNCGYCISTWIASLFSLLCVVNVSEYLTINLFITSIIVHRLSNILHAAIKAIERFNANGI